MDTAKIAEALAAFQAEMPTVHKGKTADTGKYRYTYADLSDVSEAAMPLLTKHGLAFSCSPQVTEGGTSVLVGRLLHTSGESLEGTLPIRGNSPQEIGSALTYMRRYLFGCITGLVTDDDDDGQLAQQAKKAAAPRKRAEPKAETGEAISDPQLKKIGALMREQGMTDRTAALEFVVGVVGRQVESRNDLSKAEASRCIDALQKMRDAQTAPMGEPPPDDGEEPPGGGNDR